MRRRTKKGRQQFVGDQEKCRSRRVSSHQRRPIPTDSVFEVRGVRMRSGRWRILPFLSNQYRRLQSIHLPFILFVQLNICDKSESAIGKGRPSFSFSTKKSYFSGMVTQHTGMPGSQKNKSPKKIVCIRIFRDNYCDNYDPHHHRSNTLDPVQVVNKIQVLSARNETPKRQN
jgi:hypothetical protein